MKTIRTDKYELIDVRRIRTENRSVQIGVMRSGYGPDRLYAWAGRHDAPQFEMLQGSLETVGEFMERVRDFVRWGNW